MRQLINIIIIFMLFAFVSTAIAGDQHRRRSGPYKSPVPTIAAEEHNCTVILVNNTDKLYAFRLSWIDHPFLHQTGGKPWHKTGGELQPKEPFIPTDKQTPGLYIITYWESWQPNKTAITKNFTVTDKNKKIIIILVPDDNKDPTIFIFKYDK